MTTSAAAGLCAARRFQHRVGLADARGGAEENAQAPAPGAGLFCADLGEQLVRVGARVDHELAYSRSLTVGASSARLSRRTLTRGSPRKPNVRPSVSLRHQRADVVLRHAAQARHARDLVLGGGRRDVRVEAAAGRGDEVDRYRADRLPGSAVAQRLDATRDGLDQRGVGRREVRARRGAAVVRLRTRWPTAGPRSSADR